MTEATDSGPFGLDIPPTIRPPKSVSKVEKEDQPMASYDDVVDAAVDDFNVENLYYPMSKKTRGLFVIFNHKNYKDGLNLPQRHGTDADKENLTKVWTKLGFKVESHDNLTKKALVNQATYYAKMDHRQYDCFACAVLSHGEEGDTFYAHDDEYEVKKLIQIFQDCKSLVAKPKLFFIQACRGRKLDEGKNAPGDVVDAGLLENEPQQLTLPTEADVLVAYSTVEGYYSWRHQQEGSWFIKQLTLCLEKYYEQHDLMTILTLVNRNVGRIMSNCTDRGWRGKKQSPSIVSQLTSLLHFGRNKASVSLDELQAASAENAEVPQVPSSSTAGVPGVSTVDGKGQTTNYYELKLRALQKKEELLKIKEQIYKMKLSSLPT